MTAGATAAPAAGAVELPRSANDPWAISSTGLTKRFGSRAAVDGIDVAVPRGSVYGFLGPNGSGKTTTIRMMLGLIGASAGSVRVLGQPMPRSAPSVLPRVGSLVEGPAFHPYLSGRANLTRLDAARRQGRGGETSRRIDAALDRVGLLAAGNKRYRAYSLGMRQRLALAAALLVPRELLVLDEPTNGLDPQGTREVRSLIASLAGAGTTVFVSSHLLSEVEQVCSHVGIMREGRLVAQGDLAEVTGQSGTRPLVTLVTADPAHAAELLTGLGLVEVRAADQRVTAYLPPTGDPAPETVVAALVAGGVGVREFTVRRPRLEDLYITLTGEGFDVGE